MPKVKADDQPSPFPASDESNQLLTHFALDWTQTKAKRVNVHTTFCCNEQKMIYEKLAEPGEAKERLYYTQDTT